MLPGCSGGMIDHLRLSWIEGACERAADLAEDVPRRDGGRPRVSILKQRLQSLTRMAMSDRTAEGAPQPLDAVGLRIVRRGVHQHELPAQLGQQLSEQQ